MKDLIAKYNEYQIQLVWDPNYGVSDLEKFGTAVLGFDLNRILFPLPEKGTNPEMILNAMLQHFATLKELNTKILHYASLLSYPAIDIQHDNKSIKREVQKKLFEIKESISQELEHMPRFIAEVLEKVSIQNFPLGDAKNEANKITTQALALLDIKLTSLADNSDYIEQMKRLAIQLGDQKKLLHGISYNISTRLNKAIPNKELREKVTSYLMPNADKSIKSINHRLTEIAKTILHKNLRVRILLSEISDLCKKVSRHFSENNNDYIKRLAFLKNNLLEKRDELKVLKEIARNLIIKDVPSLRDDSVVVGDILNYVDQLASEQQSSLQAALDQIEDTTKDIKKPLRKFVERCANELGGPNSGTPKIILITYHDDEREILGVPSGDHTGIILCGGGREPLCLSFYGNRQIVKREKTGLEGFILKSLHIPHKIIAGHFHNIDSELNEFERHTTRTADTIVFECHDDIGLNFDAVYQWAQEQIKNPIDYDFRTTNCAAFGLNALMKGLEGNEKNKEYAYLLEDESKVLGTTNPQKLHNCAIKIDRDIAIRRNQKAAVEFANDEKRFMPQQYDALKAEIVSLQTFLELKSQYLRALKQQEDQNPLLAKTFDLQDLAFVGIVRDAYNLIISNLPPQSDNIRDRELYLYYFSKALADFDHYICTKYDRNYNNREIYKLVRDEIYKLRKIINPDESKSVYYKLNLDVEQILYQSNLKFAAIYEQYPNVTEQMQEIKDRHDIINKQIQEARKPVTTQENKHVLSSNANRLITAIKVVQNEIHVLQDRYREIEGEIENIDSRWALSRAEKKRLVTDKYREVEFNEQLQTYYHQLSDSLTSKFNEINQHLYLESPDARTTLPDKAPFIQLWKSLLPTQPDLTENYDHIISKVISDIANRKAPQISKPWFFQFWKKPAYEEQQAQYAFEAILKNKQLSYINKIAKIKKILKDNLPRNYEVWFNGKAVNERMARFAEMKEKAFLVCMFEAFVNSEMDRDDLVEKITVLVNNSKNEQRKVELNKLIEGLNILNTKYRQEEESAKSKLREVIAPQPVPGQSSGVSPVPVAAVDVQRVPSTKVHLPTEALLRDRDEHFFERLQRHQIGAGKDDKGLQTDTSVEVGGPEMK